MIIDDRAFSTIIAIRMILMRDLLYRISSTLPSPSPNIPWGQCPYNSQTYGAHYFAVIQA